MFEEKADLEEDSEYKMSFDRFTFVCVEEGLFSDES